MVVNSLKFLARFSGNTVINKPSNYSTLHNDLLYYAKQANVPVITSNDLRVDENLNVFLGQKLITPENCYILNSWANLTLLKALDFKVESYPGDIVKEKSFLNALLEAKGFPIPPYTIKMPLDSGYPCIAKAVAFDGTEFKKVILNEEDLDNFFASKDTAIVEKAIGIHNKEALVSFKVWTYFYKVIAIVTEISKHRPFTLTNIIPKNEDLIFVPIYPLVTIKLKKLFTLDSRNVSLEKLSEKEKDLVSLALNQENISFTRIQDKIKLNKRPENIIDLATKVSEFLKLGFARIDIIQENKFPYITRIKTYSSFNKVFPFYKLFQEQLDLSAYIWKMLYSYYKIFN